MSKDNQPKTPEASELKTRPCCPTCTGKVEGRTDKIFCGIPCKNKHHSDARVQFKSRFETSINRIKRNYLVLEGIMGKDHNKMRIHQDSLFEHGFDILYAMKTFKKGRQVIYEIGEYQFSLGENGIVEVKRLLALSKWMPGFFERWLVDFPLNWKVGSCEGGKDKLLKNNILVRMNK